MRRVRLSLFTSSAFFLLAQCLSSQVNRPSGQVSLVDTTAQLTLDVHDSRPLFSAVTKIKEYYGWVVDYEDPEYSAEDLVDDTDPKWLATHPNGKHVTRPSGDAFRTIINKSEFLDSSGLIDRSAFLSGLLGEFNTNALPGTFTLAPQDNGRIAVVGVSRVNKSPLFDRTITVPSGTVSAGNALGMILSQLSAQSGKKVLMGAVPIAVLTSSTVMLSRGEQRARDLLAAILDSLPRQYDYEAMYDADAQMYMVNIELAVRVSTDAGSQEHRTPLKAGKP